MPRLILAHAPADELVAQAIGAALEIPGLVILPVTTRTRAPALGPGVVLGLIWSAHANDDLVRFAGDGGGVFLIRTDESAVNAALTYLRLAVAGPPAKSEDIHAAMKMTRLTRAPQRPVRGIRAADLAVSSSSEADGASYSRLFMSGLTRGLASSLAVVGVGGGITLGIQESAGAVNVSSWVGGDEAAPSNLQVTMRSAHLLSDTQLLMEARQLREAEAANRGQVGETLTIAGEQLADARVRTDRIMMRLKQIADSTDATPVSSPAQIAVAPSVGVPLHAADPAPLIESEPDVLAGLKPALPPV